MGGNVEWGIRSPGITPVTQQDPEDLIHISGTWLHKSCAHPRLQPLDKDLQAPGIDLQTIVHRLHTLERNQSHR